MRGICSFCQSEVDLEPDMLADIGRRVWICKAHGFMGDRCEGSGMDPETIVDAAEGLKRFRETEARSIARQAKSWAETCGKARVSFAEVDACIDQLVDDAIAIAVLLEEERKEVGDQARQLARKVVPVAFRRFVGGQSSILTEKGSEG